jgi:hypothetical protein
VLEKVKNCERRAQRKLKKPSPKLPLFRTFFWGYKILKEAEKGYWDRDGQLSG